MSTLIAQAYSVGLPIADVDAIIELRASAQQFEAARGAMQRAAEFLATVETRGRPS